MYILTIIPYSITLIILYILFLKVLSPILVIQMDT